jgi:AcrR family transcriptional regulator
VPTSIDGRSGRSALTRDAILATAERLFAEHGVVAVSNRLISEAAGQGNNTAVGYHFGSKRDLIRAIAQRHQLDIEARRSALMDRLGESDVLREWVECLIRPMTEHLASLPSPTWFARLSAQVATVPDLRTILDQDALGAPSLHVVLHHIERLSPVLPAAVRESRHQMVKQLLVHVCAERELVGAEAGVEVCWTTVSVHLVDAVTALWLAPWTPVPQR